MYYKESSNNIFTVIMALCDTEVKKALTSFKEINKKLASMTLMKAIKKIVSPSGLDNLHAKHNKTMAHTNFMGLYQEMFQDIQDFRDQYMDLCKACTELGLCFGRCKEDAKAILLK